MTMPLTSAQVAIAERASMRRADWRFLLPAPPDGGFDHLVLLGGPAGLADRIAEQGLARRVSRALPGGPTADAVVALHDARASIASVAASLAPGGSLYYEVDRRQPANLAATPVRTRRALRSAGLQPTGSYWAAPNFDNCKRYVPLDTPGALRWYLSTLYTAGTPLHWLIGLGLRALARGDAAGFASLAPCYAVTATAGPVSPAEPSVLGDPALLSDLQGSGLRPLVLTSGQDEGSRVVLLPFAPASTAPAAVIKLATLPGFNANTEREQAALADLRARLDAQLRRGIPQPLGLLRYGDLAVGLESCAAGRTLVASSGRWGAPAEQKLDDLRAATCWLANFHQQTQLPRPRWDAAQAERWIEQPLDAYARVFGLSADERKLFTVIREQSMKLTGAWLPIVWQHNDFGPWNIYRAGQDITVIDWESGAEGDADRAGPALCDLLYFATHWSYIARGQYGEAAELRAFRALFVAPEGDRILLAAHAAIESYMAALGIDQRFLPLLLTYTWVRRALDRRERQRALAAGGATARAGNRYVRYVGILAEHIGSVGSAKP